MKRDFNEWLKTFRSSICDYKYYVDFEKAYKNVETVKVELNILNSLIGSKNIESDFAALIKEYPQVIKCIPILLAVRSREIYAIDADGEYIFKFNKMANSLDDYAMFMRKTGLFELISNRIINNLYDYVTGVEVGLDSNGRKNRGGHLMEDLVENYLIEAGFQKNKNYFKEMYLQDIEKRWGIDLSSLSNNGKSKKRFDFVIKTKDHVYTIETNFYSGNGGGSKLNETARSYKLIAQEAQGIPTFHFVWITDGTAWNSARHNLEETFDVLDDMYCISDLEKGIITKLFI